MDRRSFLIGLFGTMAVAAAGAIPKALEIMPEPEFVGVLKKAAEIISGAPEIWRNEKGDYSFRELPGFWPLREESDKIATRALTALYSNYQESVQ
jgi:hypothetical protein